jgi:hypothetical protein
VYDVTTEIDPLWADVMAHVAEANAMQKAA